MVSDFGPSDAAAWIAVPGPDDDKYSRGVLGMATGSPSYPGAAVLGVDAAMHTGVGMLRYLGAERPTALVLARRPEAVVVPGRVQAWVIGSGQADDPGADTAAQLEHAFADVVPTVIDAGALAHLDRVSGTRVLVPHAGELARLLDITRPEVDSDRVEAAHAAAERFDAVVLLKGSTTLVADQTGAVLSVEGAPGWTATAGSGDALAGVLGALLATHHLELEADQGVALQLAATAAVVHGLAAARASHGGPFTVLELCAEIPGAIRGLLAVG